MFNRINTNKDRALEIEWQHIQERSLNIEKAYEKLYGKEITIICELPMSKLSRLPASATKLTRLCNSGELLGRG